MSRDDPFDKGGKTVIRPNPGGAGAGVRRPEPGQYQPQQPGQAPWPPQQPGQPQQAWQPGQPQTPTPGGFNPRVNAPTYQPQPGGFGMPPPGPDDWMNATPRGQGLFPQAPPPQAPQAAKIPLEVALNARDGGQISSANPITAAAAPLLILLGRLRLGIIDMQAVPLMQHVANEIVEFEKKILAAGVDPHDAQVAKYAICGTADDIVQNLPGADRAVWMQFSMLAQFFQVRTSGVGFYDELAKILQNPVARYDLLELMHACLSLGFEGRYRGDPNGANELQRVRRTVYETLRRMKSRADDDVSPRWRGLDLRMRDLTSRVPLWAIAAVAAVLLLGVFFTLRFLLSNDGDLTADRLIALHPTAQVQLAREAFVQAVIPDVRDPTQLERVRDNLGVVDDSCVAADSVGDEIVIKVCNVLLFDSGKATVREDFAELATRIAASLDGEPGPIRIIGHTDNVKPSSTARFKSNFDLSVARAEAVKGVMEPLISDPSRFIVEGRAEQEPLCRENTDSCRAQNRRVEIQIPREETLN